VIGILLMPISLTSTVGMGSEAVIVTEPLLS